MAAQEKFNKIPEVDFKLSSTGITILCPRLYTPRFIPFDIAGRCEICKSDTAEIDYTIYCSRLARTKFVPYDLGYELFPSYCLFRIKTRGKVFNIQHGKKNKNDFGGNGCNIFIFTCERLKRLLLHQFVSNII